MGFLPILLSGSSQTLLQTPLYLLYLFSCLPYCYSIDLSLNPISD